MGVKMWQDANPGKEMTMEEQKTLEQGCSTTLVAALDPRIAGIFPFHYPCFHHECLCIVFCLGVYTDFLL